MSEVYLLMMDDGYDHRDVFVRAYRDLERAQNKADELNSRRTEDEQIMIHYYVLTTAVF
jgi:hypothetical protein